MEAEASRSVATIAQVSVHLVLSSAGFGRTFFFVILFHQFGLSGLWRAALPTGAAAVWTPRQI